MFITRKYADSICALQVAYVVGHIIDGGQTIVTRAGRTDPNFAAKGINIMLTQYLFDWGHSLGAITKVYTTSDTNPALNSFLQKSDETHIDQGKRYRLFTKRLEII